MADYTFGATRFSEGAMPTEYHFTGQREDGTGLYYYNSRFYDPYLGNFISPDTVVPDPTKVDRLQPVLVCRRNLVKYNDPSGHQNCAAGDTACWQNRWAWMNRWYEAHGYFWSSNAGHWAIVGDAQFADEGILDDTVGEAGIQWDSIRNYGSWTFDRKVKVATGIVKFGQRLSGGLERIAALVGGRATMAIVNGGNLLCRFGNAPCSLPTWGNTVLWPAEYIDARSKSYIAAEAVMSLPVCDRLAKRAEILRCMGQQRLLCSNYLWKLPK